MNVKPTWTSVLCFGVGILAVAGCEPQPSGELAALPVHRLDLSAPRPSDSVAARRYTAVPPRPAENRWAVKGYRPWRYIVIHHSASDRGNAAIFDRVHRQRGWDEMGYHFVIDNGDGGPDGHIEVGGRWRIQKWGAHCGGTPDNEYNNYGIGICLVGTFTDRLPSPAQLASLRRLVLYLARRYDIPPRNVIGHRDAPNASTVCPGKPLHEYVHHTLRPLLARSLAIAK